MSGKVMSEKTKQNLFNFNLTLQMVGVIGHQFFYWVQENFYGDPNFLKPVSDALNNQTSATSFFAVLGMIGSGMSFFMIYAFNNKPTLFGLSKMLWLYILPIIPVIVYTAYEYHQMLHPTYPDNHILDLVVAWIAPFVYWTAYTWCLKKPQKVITTFWDDI